MEAHALFCRIVTSDLVPLRRRGVFQGLGNIVYAAGASLGGPLGEPDSGSKQVVLQVTFCLQAVFSETRSDGEPKSTHFLKLPLILQLYQALGVFDPSVRVKVR